MVVCHCTSVTNSVKTLNMEMGKESRDRQSKADFSATIGPYDSLRASSDVLQTYGSQFFFPVALIHLDPHPQRTSLCRFATRAQIS